MAGEAGYGSTMRLISEQSAWCNLIVALSLGAMTACTTVTYPNGTRVTTPYVAPVYAPVYGSPGYPVPVAPYAPPGTPGAYFGYGGGYAPLFGVGAWANLGGWGWGWNRSWSPACRWNQGSVLYRSCNAGCQRVVGVYGVRRGY